VTLELAASDLLRVSGGRVGGYAKAAGGA
jgi:hypothetical protein